MTTVTNGESTRYVLARYPDAVYAERVATVGENVRRLRLKAGMSTQTELAERMHIPQPRVSDLENDRYGFPDTKTLMTAATAIGCLVDDLLSDVDPEYDARKRSGPTGDRPVKTATMRRAERLLWQMNEEGQLLAVKNIALLVRSFPSGPPPVSIAKPDQTPSGKASKGRGTR